MKHVLLSDTHIHPFTQFCVGDGTTNSRVQRTLNCVQEAIDYAVENNIQSIIHLGDVFHVKVRQQYEYFNAAYNTFRQAKLQGIKLTIMMGNHDIVTKSQNCLTFDAFKDIAEFVKTPQVFSPELWLIPYTPNFEQAVQWLKEVPESAIVLHHLDVVGADTGLGWVSEIGIGSDNLTRFKLSLGGHYHKRQQILPNAWYMGCNCPQDFNCPDQPGYFCVLDDVTGEVEWHTNSAPIFTVFDPRQGQRDLKNHYVKVILERTPAFEEWLKTTGAISWFFAPELKKINVIQREKGISLEASHEQVVKTFAAIHQGELPLDKLTEVGLSLLEAT